ncbi:MAG: amidohydrolase family protein [Anaerolineaceae bacterium]|nr:amidohydrolase family protein [Anaerolineaceae bacterium]
MKATLILPAWLIANAHQKPLHQWGVRVVGDSIQAVAPNDELRRQYPGDERVEAPNSVLSAGFVNAHTHLYGILAHGIPLSKAPSGFWPFLEEFWWPLIENRLDHAMICAATDLRCAHMLQSGVTAFYDCTEAPNALPGVLPAQAEVVRRHGLRGVLSFEASQRVSENNGQLGLRENADFVDDCRPGGGLVSGLISTHTTFTCDAAFIRQAFALAQERGVLLHAHVSEGTYEPEFALQHYGVRTLAYYDRLGVAGPGFLASQCVQLSDEEIGILADRGVRVSHMPLSNCEVGGGIAPVPQMVARGVTLGLGTDGYIDDFFEVMRGAFLIHKANQLDPRLMPAHVVWYLATEGGARALGFEKVGRLEPGWKADLQLIGAGLPTPVEEHNLFEQLVLYRNAADVEYVMVDGIVRVAGGQVLSADWLALHAHTHEAAQRLWAQARVD